MALHILTPVAPVPAYPSDEDHLSLGEPLPDFNSVFNDMQQIQVSVCEYRNGIVMDHYRLFVLVFFTVQLWGQQPEPVPFGHELPNLLLDQKTIKTRTMIKKPKRKDKPKLQQCERCKKSFTQLAKHKFACLKLKPYVCKICQNPFSQKSNLNRHIASKHGDEYYFCATCSYKCKRKDKLKLHIVNHHS